MFLTNFTINELIDNINFYIDKETNEYFNRMEKKVLNSFVENISIFGVYNIHKKDIIEKVFHTEDFNQFILQLIEKIDSQLSDNHIESFEGEINLNLNMISKLRFNHTLLNQYKFSYFLAQGIEKNIDDMIDFTLLSGSSNQLLRHFFSKIPSAHMLLSLANLSWSSFYKRHRADIEKKVKGILINFRTRFKKELKSQVYKYLLSLQETNIKIA